MAANPGMNATLGDFLRAKRQRLQPPGLTASTRRRTPGLRREEVAERARVSLDWYVRLEQNRATSPSTSVLDRVSQALELTNDERVYVYRLAGRDDALLGTRREAAHPSTVAVLRNITTAPACILGPRLDVLGSNDAYDALFLGLGVSERFGRNVPWFVFCDDRAPALFVDFRAVIAEVTAALRAAFARNVDDPAFLALIGELSRHSPLFVAQWAEQNVRDRTHGRKQFRHPVEGVLDFDWHCVAPREAPEQFLAVYEARDAATRAAVARMSEPRPR